MNRTTRADPLGEGVSAFQGKSAPDDGLRVVAEAWGGLPPDVRRLIVGVVQRTREAKGVRNSRLRDERDGSLR